MLVSSFSGFRISVTDADGEEIPVVNERVRRHVPLIRCLADGRDGWGRLFTPSARSPTAEDRSQTAAPRSGITGNGDVSGQLRLVVHSTPKVTEFFSADATLTANFDVKQIDEMGDATVVDAAGGTVTGHDPQHRLGWRCSDRQHLSRCDEGARMGQLTTRISICTRRRSTAGPGWEPVPRPLRPAT